jgi:hypothetical protein
MAQAEVAPRNVAELIDRIDRIREELHIIQRSLEKLEPAAPGGSRDEKSK